MLMTQDAKQTAAEIRQQVQSAVQEAVQAAKEAKAQAQQVQGKGAPQAPTAPQAPVALTPVPVGGGRVIIDKQGDRTVITTAAVPPDVIPLAQMAQETALGLMGLLAAMVILGPFARVLARRMGHKADLAPASAQNQVVQQQLAQLQQAVDTMALEVERISEAQRFQTKPLSEGRGLDR
jgi:hypothetical protein